MRFLIIRKADKNTEAGVMPGDDLISAMGSYNQELANAGAMLDGTGLKPSDKGARIKFSGGKPTVFDGPFAETKELIAGYTMIQAKSKEEAIEWACRWPALDGDGEVELEIRQLYELEDFAPSEGLEQHKTLRAQLSAKPPQVNTYLFFNGQCKEAFEYYAQVLGGKIEYSVTFAECPDPTQNPPGWEDKIMHICMTVGDRRLMASDTPPGHFEEPKGFFVQLDMDTPEEADRLFNALLEGGQVRMPLQQTFWAQRFGMLVDRFGTPWMINCNQPV
ncbi:YciI family protein [Hahella sp. HN01]|uniref:YciI family protein n=1 Tax=Hahella sp. HN01 TaxID=2847262 RepID=UPI001C1ED2F7|nr:YciI family protein [Hahella sp. HN01]MBU6950168.1 VOC family protein [Hahella sp. HN01]